MNKYTLLALSGLAPQVVTEAAWSLARQHHPPLLPSRVEIIATGVGAAYGRALLKGMDTSDPVTGQPVSHSSDRWTPFCKEVFGEVVPLNFHVPTASGQPLPDITGIDADRRFADLCYQLVAEHTSPDAPPLIGSIAGGRKTLSAHLMAAFTVYARPQDRLIHVLVHPASVERDPSFFYPTQPSDVRIHRIDVPFPRLRTLLEGSPVRQALQEGADLRTLLSALEPHLLAEQSPDSFHLRLYQGRSELTASAKRQTIGTVRLTPAETATLITIANALTSAKGRTRLDQLADNPIIEMQRADVLSACSRFEQLRPWSEPADVSKAVCRLNRTVSVTPVLARFFSIESDVLAEATFYRWAEPLPTPLQFTASTSPTHWRFSHISLSVSSGT